MASAKAPKFCAEKKISRWQWGRSANATVVGIGPPPTHHDATNAYAAYVFLGREAELLSSS